ncbi:hypothetical protein K4L44_01125 [Halosquirtibacter laminarini]|uniref:Uncharacterized protein n=1 Tax=Halosquirtibacter laminarini TaxID=3374600 RepID=A0AC61NPP4_9BACT|nr:hypothetical protein K4L44_01125 [Prolixibacteraceae bacterium]
MQIYILNNVYWLGYVNPQVFLLGLLLLPFQVSGGVLLLISFFLGLLIDVSTNTLGLHTAATLLVGFIRPTVISLISSRDVYEKGSLPRIRYYGLQWFVKYCFILTFVYTMSLYLIESFSFANFVEIIQHSLITTSITVLIMVLSQFIFIKD